MQAQRSAPTRRSQRYTSVHYDANGRDYLASVMGWSKENLEQWMTTDTVQKHLLLWQAICIDNHSRYKVAKHWIDTGEAGYYYNPSGLEEDLLLLCLGEGNVEDQELESREVADRYVDKQVATHQWSTQELWARTAWRIVQANKGHGQAFERIVVGHAAAAYGFVIDILCIAFHSVAFRHDASVWCRIISRGRKTSQWMDEITAGVNLDRSPDETGELVEEEDDDGADSTANTERSTIVDSDSEFEDPSSTKTKGTSVDIESPKTPRRMASQKRQTSSSSVLVTEWMERVYPSSTDLHRPLSTAANSEMLQMFDAGTGEAILGYRKAASLLEVGASSASN